MRHFCCGVTDSRRGDTFGYGCCWRSVNSSVRPRSSMCVPDTFVFQFSKRVCLWKDKYWFLKIILFCSLQPVLVSGMHKKMNFSLWKAESISLDFGNQQADILNCKDSIISNTNVKEFWDGFEDVSSMFLKNVLWYWFWTWSVIETAVKN